jgi:hypothetical protein
VPYFISDLLEELELEAGRLEKSSDPSRYIRLKLKMEEMWRDPRYAFMFGNSLMSSDSMGDLLSKLLRIPTQSKPLTIVDVSGMPSEIVNVVVSMISRLVFDYSIWSREEPSVPILLVCEEAQRYLPREDGNVKSAAQRNFERIAKEGRKHGTAVRSVGGGAVAVRLAVRPAADHRARPGLHQECGSRLGARRGERHLVSAQPRMHRLRRSGSNAGARGHRLPGGSAAAEFERSQLHGLVERGQS